MTSVNITYNMTNNLNHSGLDSLENIYDNKPTKNKLDFTPSLTTNLRNL